jgi:hypothetical protein
VALLCNPKSISLVNGAETSEKASQKLFHCDAISEFNKSVALYLFDVASFHDSSHGGKVLFDVALNYNFT